jgi:Spy/CpxP family protein refolding chaperone
MRATVISFIVAAAFIAAPAGARTQPSQADVAANNSVASVGGASVKAAKKVSKRLPSSYSNMSKRVCLTEQQWQQIEEEAR